MAIYQAVFNLDDNQIDFIHDYIENDNENNIEPIELGVVAFDDEYGIYATIWLDDGEIDSTNHLPHLYAEFAEGDMIMGGASIDLDTWDLEKYKIDDRYLDNAGNINLYSIYLVRI